MKVKKVVTICLVAAMTMSCLAGCGGKKNKGGTSQTDVEIAYWNSGLGTDWLDAMIEAFEKEHPEYNVYYKASADDSAIMGTLGKEEVDTVDIYMGLSSYDTKYLEPFDSLLEKTCEDDKTPLKDKIDDRYLELVQKADGHYYGLPFAGGIMGIVYNTELFDKIGVSEPPRTTDELAAICDEFYNKGIAATAHFKSGAGGYWEFITDAWIAQYCGMDYYLNNLYACADEQGNAPSKAAMTNKEDGRYQTLCAYEKFITPDYVLSGSNTNDHITSQTMFINGEAAMMANGSWLSNEMDMNEAGNKFLMMRMPILSAIKNKLSTVNSESLLRKLVSAIDSVTDGEKALTDYAKDGGYDIDGTIVSETDWNTVADARNALSVSYSGQHCLIPTYSNAKEGAMKFMEFMYSDMGYKIYADKLHTVLPMSLSEGELDTSDWGAFETELYKLYQNSTYFVSNVNGKRHDIYINGGASLFPNCTNFVNYFCSKNPADRMTADQVWDKMMQNIDDNYEKNWLENIK